MLACELCKPLFLHERDAHVEMVELLTRYQSQLPICVIHCFTGTKGSVLSVVDFEGAEVLCTVILPN